MVKKKSKKKAAGDEQICRRKIGIQPPTRSGELDCLTENPLTTSNKMKKKKLPPDEQRCSHTDGKTYRCKNFRMGYGPAAATDSVSKTKRCEKHYNYFAKYNKKCTRKKKTSGDGEDDDTSDIEGVSANVGTKREMKKLPPDGQRCSMTGGGGWRCKNFRMGHGAAAHGDSVPKAKRCEKHYYYRKKKQTGNGKTRASKWGNKVKEEDEIQKPGATSDHTSHTIVESGESAKFGTKMKDVQRTERSGALNSLTKTREPVVETRAAKRRKMVIEGARFIDETSNQPATNDKTREPVVVLESLEHFKCKCYELSVELEKQKMEIDKKNVVIEENKVEIEQQKMEIKKQKLELEKMKEELEKKNVEYTTFQVKYAELETKNTAAENENAVKYWRNKCSDLESLLLKMEAEHSTMRCEGSRVSNLDILIPRNGKESSIVRCEELRDSEKFGSEVCGWPNEITQTGENQRDKDNMSKPNAETSSGGRKESYVNELITKDKVLNAYDVNVDKHHDSESEFPKFSATNISSGSLHLARGGENVEEGKGWGCSEGRQFQHGSSSQAHLEISKENFVNLVSDSDDGDDNLGESEDSLGDPMDMLATKKWNRNKHEMQWKSEPEMLSSFEEAPELCMRAVCALYRQEISEDEISPKGLVIEGDTLRCTTLAKFLMDSDCKGDLKKSVKELEKFDSKAVGDCKKLARRYSVYLFDIYKQRKDPFFLPATTASNGDQNAK